MECGHGSEQRDLKLSIVMIIMSGQQCAFIAPNCNTQKNLAHVLQRRMANPEVRVFLDVRKDSDSQ